MPAAKRRPPLVRYRAAFGVEVTWCEGQTILIHRADRSSYRLNGLAARIWTLVGKGASPRTIVVGLRREVGAPSSLIENETARVLERLLAAGLIEPRHP